MNCSISSLLKILKEGFRNPSSLQKRARAFKNRKIRTSLLKKYAAEYPEIYDGITQTLERFHSNGGFGFGHNQVVKLLNLHHTLTKLSPSSLIEYGTGSSTFVNSSYAIINKITYQGIEENQKWVLANREFISGEYDTQLDINLDQYSRVDRIVDDKLVSTETTFMPSRYYDFIFIDGPSLEINKINSPQSYNTDIDKHMRFKNPRVICIDNRRSTTEYIRLKYGKNYNFIPSDNWLFEERIIDPERYNYFSLFILKE